MEEVSAENLNLRARIRELEMRLAENEEPLDYIIDHLPIGLQIFDRDGNSCLVNRKQRELLGLLTDPYSISTGSDQRYQEAYNGRTVSHEYEFDFNLPENGCNTRKDKCVFSETIFPVYSERGQVSHVVVLLTDISDQDRSREEIRLSQEKYKALFVSAGDAAFVMKRNQFIDCNERAADLFLMSREELVNSYPWDLSPPVQPCGTSSEELATEKMDAVLRGEVQRFEWVHQKGDGVLFDAEVTLNIVDPKNEVFYAILRDITKRKRAEEELKRINEELKTVIATKDKLFSIISHDLRSPFGAIIGFSELAITNMSELDHQQLKNYLDNIHHAGQQSYDLLNNLLEWSKLQTGPIQFHPEEFSLGKMIREIITLFRMAIDNKSLSVVSHIEEDFRIRADRQMINTVMRNLLSNAIKFTAQGRLITMDASRTGSQVEIRVSDSGIGIPEEDISRLFRAESNVSRPGTDKEKGTGLGLVLSFDFVKMHGGEIGVESEQGKGSTFTVRLPDA